MNNSALTVKLKRVVADWVKGYKHERAGILSLSKFLNTSSMQYSTTGYILLFQKEASGIGNKKEVTLIQIPDAIRQYCVNQKISRISKSIKSCRAIKL